MTLADQASVPGAPPCTLDVADGIARVMGDRALYARLLKRFQDDYGNGAAPIRSALDSGDLVLAHRLIHTLKGAAGMISAHGLHSHACALERALHEGARDAPLDALSAELARLRPAIDRLLDGQAAAATPPASAASDHALVARLADLLAQGDGAAIDLLEQSAASMTATLGPARFRDVARAVNEFDFEAALKALRQDGEANAAGG